MTYRRVLLTASLAVVLCAALVTRGSAGPDKIKYPAGWKDHVLYTTVDRYDVKQYRELYASSPAAVQAMKEGKPLPDGTVLTLIQYKAEVGRQGPIQEGRHDRRCGHGETRGLGHRVSGGAP